MNDTLEPAQIVLEKIEYYYTPILVHLGTLGNCLTIYVILKTKLCKLSSSYCLVALAISDNVSLINIFIVWLGMNDIDIYNRQIFCQLMTYCQSVCSCLSVWLVVTFTVERFVAVMYPLHSKLLCTIFRVKLIIFILILFSLIIYCPLLYFAAPIEIEEAKKEMCMVKPEWSKVAFYFNICDTIITFVIPVGVIAVLNAGIIGNIWKFSKIRKRMTDDQQSTSSKKKSKEQKSYYMTKMLLMVSTVCLMMNLPSYITRIMSYLIHGGVIEISNRKAFITAQQFFFIIFNTNFGINFILYCISGQNFRNAVASICCKKKPKANESSTTERTQSTSSTGYKRRRPKMQMIPIAMMSVLLDDNQGITLNTVNSDDAL